MALEYKLSKEAFVANLEGSTLFTINSVCATSLTSYWIYSNLTLTKPTTRTVITEFTVLILPLILSLTLLSNHVLKLNLFLSIVALSLSSQKSIIPSQPPSNSFQKYYVTVYRAQMMIVTIISILAVDYNVFPRHFAKAETWGTSIMDLGVGSFVFSMGLVSALPLLRNTQKRLWRNIVHATKRSLGVLALGLIRVLMVKGVDYPEHVTEYGIHWNFFFTLGTLPIAGAIFEKLSPQFDLTLVALLISALHQATLTLTSLQNWTLTTPRLNLISMNKEGLVSLPGYLAIYMLGISAGLYILPPDPSFYARLHQKIKVPSYVSPVYIPPRTTREEEVVEVTSALSTGREMERSPSSSLMKPSRSSHEALHPKIQFVDSAALPPPIEIGNEKGKKSISWKLKDGKLISVMISWTIVWWSFYFILVNMGGFTVSRKLANISYVIWVTAFNTTFLLGFLTIGRISSMGVERNERFIIDDGVVGDRDEGGQTPFIFRAVNKNGLIVFLIANLLTGLINVSSNTLLASDLLATTIITVYAAIVVGLAWLLRGKSLRL